MTPNPPKWRFIVPPFKNWGQTPPKRGGVSWKTLLLLVFGGPKPPVLGVIFTVNPFKIDPRGTIFTVKPLFLMIFGHFLNGFTMKMTPPGGSNFDPFWGGTPIQWPYRPPKNVKNERFLRAPKVGIGRNRNGLHRKS